MTQEDRDTLVRLIKEAYLEDDKDKGLIPAIADALGKNGVLLALIDVRGAILTIADNRADTPHAVRDRSMILQMCALFNENMDAMMKKAGRVARGEDN